MVDKLTRYNDKRDFSKTAEPKGALKKTLAALRYAVQHHMARRDHYDLRLEWGGVLLSWAVPKGPSFNPGDKRLAVMVENHPLDYRGFEGTIPKGEYGGGTVMLWDEGFWEPQSNVDDGLQAGSLKFTIHGERLAGKWALVRMHGDDGDSKQNWLLIKEKDEHAKKTAGIKSFNKSVKTGRTMAEIAKGDGDNSKRQPPQTQSHKKAALSKASDPVTKRMQKNNKKAGSLSDTKVLKNPFEQAPVQLAKLAKSVPRETGWLYEIKYDGYRMLSFIESGKATLVSRGKHDYTAKLKGISDALATFTGERAMVLDGEVVIADQSGKSDFQALQSYMKNPEGNSLRYVVFDILALDGEDLRAKPLIERKKILSKLLKKMPSEIIESKYVRGKGSESFAAACGLKLEGIVGKRTDSEYSGTRNGDWIKIKCSNRQEFVIGGYTRTDKKKSGVSALLLGVYDNEKLRYSGRVGTGITAKEADDLESRFVQLKQKSSPFTTAPRAAAREEIFWLSPDLVAEVAFAEITDAGLLRHASYKGLRVDKRPHEVVFESAERSNAPAQKRNKRRGKKTLLINDKSLEIKKQPNPNKKSGDKKLIKSDDKKSEKSAEKKSPKSANTAINDKDLPKSNNSEKNDRKATKAKASTLSNKKPQKPATSNDSSSQKTVINGVEISNPDKIIFADWGITKANVAQYYADIAPYMLRYVSNRVLSIVRCPKGVSGECFFKKHPAADSKGVKKVSIPDSGGEDRPYFYIDKEQGLVYEAQMGTLEFHVWGSRVKTLEKPDLMVFDLDPDEGMELKQVRQGVNDVKSLLDELGLVSFLKTSGGKGYHIVVPLTPTKNWQEFRAFAKQLAELMERKWPERYTSNMRKEKRKGKIFVDWVRNSRGATSIAPYSVRARKGGKVSMPIAWDELGRVAPDGVTMLEALNRVKKGDPWKNFFKTRQKLGKR